MEGTRPGNVQASLCGTVEGKRPGNFQASLYGAVEGKRPGNFQASLYGGGKETGQRPGVSMRYGRGKSDVYDPMIVGYTELLASPFAPGNIQAGGLGGGSVAPLELSWLRDVEAYVLIRGNSQQRETDAI